MADIVKLEHPDNVQLIEGATQYWTDAPRHLPDFDWSELLVPQVRGRTLIVGWAPTPTLRAIGLAASELHVLVRGVVEAAAIGTALPEAKIWCGDPRALREYVSEFDTVLCLGDVSRVLPLESEARSWRAVVDDVLALGRAGATTAIWVENDLGIHRITAMRNPRSAHTYEDWSVLATFDESRPLSLAAVRREFPGSSVLLTWPARVWSVLVDPDRATSVSQELAATQAALPPRVGPDPVYLLATACRAGRLQDYASGWFVLSHWPDEPTAAISVAGPEGLERLSPSLPSNARPAVIVFAELLAAADLPGLRRFLAVWGERFAEPGGGAAAFESNAVAIEDGRFVFHSLRPSPTSSRDDERWEALAVLVHLVRAHHWRHPWPANWDNDRILGHLGTISGLGAVPTSQAARLIELQMIPHGEDDHLDVQSLIAAVERAEEQVASLRSELASTKSLLVRAQDRARGPVLSLPWKLARVSARLTRALLARCRR